MNRMSGRDSQINDEITQEVSPTTTRSSTCNHFDSSTIFTLPKHTPVQHVSQWDRYIFFGGSLPHLCCRNCL